MEVLVRAMGVRMRMGMGMERRLTVMMMSSYTKTNHEYHSQMRRKRVAPQYFALPRVPHSHYSETTTPLAAKTYRSTITAFKWVFYWCPDLPLPTIYNLFQTFQVLVETEESRSSGAARKPVGDRDVLSSGCTVYLPVSIYYRKIWKKRYEPLPRGTMHPNADEIRYIRSLVLYKDRAIIVLNRPTHLPAQASLGIHNSMDALAAATLSYEYEEGPKVVHRIDRESSGILVMGRTQESIQCLHDLFREKNIMPSENKNSVRDEIFEQRYWALVIGCPKEKEGVISAPLSKVALDEKPKERVIISRSELDGPQEAVTQYRVLGPTINGCSWIELCPLTGRKHQLRVHCAEALGTPIVGDYKYGWYIHKRWQQIRQRDVDPDTGRRFLLKLHPHLNVNRGTVLAKVPLLHLHCRELAIPNVAKKLGLIDSNCESAYKKNTLRFVAPLPTHMAMSWNVMASCLYLGS